MRIVIIGSGSTGAHLARRLCEEHHDVVLVDTDARRLADVEARCDVMTVLGTGSSPQTLAQAGVDKAGLVVAVTSSDEVNILACASAKKAGVERTVARVSNPDYIAGSEWFSLDALGVDLVVNQNEECALELYNILLMPNSVEVVKMLDGRLQIVGFLVGVDGPLAGARLGAFPEPARLDDVRFIALMRDGDLEIPSGDMELRPDDHAYVIGDPDSVRDFVSWATSRQGRLTKVIIAGGGGLGLPLARRLETIPKVQVVLLETDPDRAHHCSSDLARTLVIEGDALQESMLKDVGITDGTSFVAVTGEDENNILSCILAKQCGAAYVLAQVGKPEYLGIVSSVNLIDRSVNVNVTIVNAILHLARWKNIESYAFLKQVPGELVEHTLPADSHWQGQALEQIHLPKESIVAAVARRGDILLPTGKLALEAGDRVVVFAHPKVAPKVKNALRKVG